MNRGYVKLWRKSLDAGWIKNHKLWAFWSWCLMKASHKEHKVIVGRQIVHLMPGQFIFGRKKAAEETGLSEQEIRTIIAFLIKCGNLTINPTSKFSVISIVNWPIYQSEDKDNQPAHQPATNQQLTTNKNGKNGKNGKKISLSESNPDFENFYSIYPKREARKKALDAWEKIKPDQILLSVILNAIERQRTHKANLKSLNQFCPEWPLPATWLNQRRWEDEILVAINDNSNSVLPVVLKCPRCGRRIVVKADLTKDGCVYCEVRA